MYHFLALSTIWLPIALYATLKVQRWLTYVWYKRANNCEEPPGYPHKDPIWGLDLFYAQKWAGENGVWLPTSKRLFKENGKTYKINLLGGTMIHTMDPKNIQAAWANNFKDWGLQPFREGLAVPFFDKGINTTDGEFWHHSRMLIRPTFARTEVANFKSLEKHTDRFLSLIPRDGSTVDVQKLFSCLVSLLEGPLGLPPPLLIQHSSLMLLPNSSLENRWTHFSQRHQWTRTCLSDRSTTQ